jgi:leader peptidase (prepilin peptidase)/N-methyltransferase
MSTEALLQAFAFVWGAVWGSFLNVVIHRLPREESVVRPGSRCGSCGTPIRWYDNIPIASYLVLRGRCRACHTAFSPRYMLVEAACGLLSMVVLRATVLPLDPDTFGPGLLAWIWWQTFVYGLVVVTFIDLEHTFIPEIVTWPGIVLGVAGAFALPGLDGWARLWGALAGGGFLLLVVGIGYLVFRREAMGMGDVMLLAMIGAYLGWQALPFVLFASAVQALIGAGAAMAWGRVTGRKPGLVMTTREVDERFGEEDRYADQPERAALPYGPFLALAALEAMLFGGDLFWRLADALGRWIFSRVA